MVAFSQGLQFIPIGALPKYYFKHRGIHRVVAEEILEKLASLAGRTVQKVQVSSAVNPALWLCAISTPTCLLAAYFFRLNSTLCNLLVGAALIPIAVASLVIVGFAIFKPEKLESADYQLRHETLQMIQQKSGRIALDPASLQAIANPAQKALREGGKNSQ